MIGGKLFGVAVAATLLAVAPVSGASERELLERIRQLEERVAELEGKRAQEAGAPSAESSPKTLEFLGQTEISGFVSASFFHNFNDADPENQGFVRKDDQFAINKFKLALENPADANPDRWDAGFRVDLIFGEDAEVIQSRGLDLGSSGDLEQAYVQVNVPIGNGLLVKFGKMVTLMGVEVIEETANPNWTVGNQFLLVENFTQTGLLLSYAWNQKVDTQFAVFNGWDVVSDNNSAKSLMGRIGLALDEKTSIGIVGYGGPEQDDNSSNWRTGVNIVANRRLTDKLNSYLQLDYGHEDNVPGAGRNAEWWAAGLWLIYDFNEKAAFALRADCLKDSDNVRSSFGSNLYSLTGTLNLTPVENLQVRPEVRWDRSSGDGAFDGHGDQLTLGVGVAYVF